MVHDDNDCAIVFELVYLPTKESLIDAFMMEFDALLEKYALNKEDIAYSWDVEDAE